MDEVLQIGGGFRRTTQVRRSPNRKPWTKADRARFLDMLAMTCNVKLSAREAGVSVTHAYRLRGREPEFAERWREALNAGYEQLEMELVGRALQSMDGIQPGDGGEEIAAAGEAAIEKMDVRTILSVLAMHERGREKGVRPLRRDGCRKQIATEEETNAALLRKLAVLRSQMKDGT